MFMLLIYSSSGDEDIPINEAVEQKKIIVQEASTSKDFEQQESKVLKTRIPSVELSAERKPPQTTYTVTGKNKLIVIWS